MSGADFSRAAGGGVTLVMTMPLDQKVDGIRRFCAGVIDGIPATV